MGRDSAGFKAVIGFYSCIHSKTAKPQRAQGNFIADYANHRRKRINKLF
ncbi:hypothetical protein Cabys_3187 [Caldithrix abyssi DSM 13497]|uniref:Uncharacterized protein n=1 Tax=Caldithrix abyssi DSM 13497 TaxID=880073 RepID=A0A1J1CB78_CALAY|nr:hypothetical protein Cabys_3187 [Caldithrix abyssi DSM 13497]